VNWLFNSWLKGMTVVRISLVIQLSSLCPLPRQPGPLAADWHTMKYWNLYRGEGGQRGPPQWADDGRGHHSGYIGWEGVSAIYDKKQPPAVT
jgi:hypothetical protein